VIKFLIINPFGIGDVLFTTPVIRAIKDAYPDSVIGYWCNERVGGVLRNSPKINKVFALSRGDIKKIRNESWWKGIFSFLGLLRGIKREKFDISLDFSLDHRYSLISKLLGIKKRVGFNYKKRGRFLTHKIDVEGYSLRHVVEYYLDLLKPLGIKPGGNTLEFPVPESSKVKSKNMLAGHGITGKGPVIGIVPGGGASWGRDAVFKHWPALKYAQLADKLAKDSSSQIVILGDESERPITEVVVSAMKHKPLDLTGRTNLEELAALISNLNILITNDGGPLHIAVALGIKTVAVFGPVDALVYGPYPPSARHVVIHKDFDCRPCYRNFRFQGCEHDRRCTRGITVDEVYAAAHRLIKKE